MISKEENNRYPYSFIVLYAAVYMLFSIYGTFVPVYLNGIGFSKSVIGVLLAIGTLISIITQPVWGIACDRSSNMNSLLMVMFLGSGISMILYPLSAGFVFIVIFTSVYSIFQSSIIPVSDAMVLEYMENKRWKFGPVRIAGSMGYAVMSILAGILARHNIRAIFLLFFCISMIAFFNTFRLPKVRGHQSKERKTSIWGIFKSRKLIILLSFHFIIEITFGFYHSFFPIHYVQLGADSGLLGTAMVISAFSEVPFLLFADRIIKKFGTNKVLIASALIISIRWMLTGIVTNINIMLFVSATHGCTFIVFSYCLATFINKNVAKELRASGQAMNALLCIGLARMLGSSIGGVISDVTGFSRVFQLNSLICFISALIFGLFFAVTRKRGDTHGETEYLN
jgi:PPP family 3-phenylpropionic acid transporter